MGLKLKNNKRMASEVPTNMLNQIANLFGFDIINIGGLVTCRLLRVIRIVTIVAQINLIKSTNNFCLIL
jgi:hypothetical protein